MDGPAASALDIDYHDVGFVAVWLKRGVKISRYRDGERLDEADRREGPSG